MFSSCIHDYKSKEKLLLNSLFSNLKTEIQFCILTLFNSTIEKVFSHLISNFSHTRFLEKPFQGIVLSAIAVLGSYICPCE